MTMMMMMGAATVRAMVLSAVLLGLVTRAFGQTLTTSVKAADLLQRQRRDVPPQDQPLNIECVHMTSQEGEYWHLSSGSDAVCGLYVIGDVDTLVELEITDFDISCEGNGLMAVVDGWELQGELFPSPEEVDGGLAAQYQTFCGASDPPSKFLSSQNVALVQFRVPQAGQGFRVKVRFVKTPEPCNVLAPFDATTFTMRNFGSRRNCTTQILFPVSMLLVDADVRATSRVARPRREVTGLTVNCASPGGADFVSFIFGLGLDSHYFDTQMAFCGRRSKVARRAVTLGCSNSAFRLVSSGLYYNSVTVIVTPPNDNELESFLAMHPGCAPFNWSVVFC